MTWLWILGIVVSLLFLLCVTRVGAWVKVSGSELTLDVKFGVFRIHILPKKEKKPDPKKEAKKAAADAEAAAKKAEKKAKKDAEKAKLKEARKGEPFSCKTARLKELLADIREAVDAIWPPLKRGLKRIGKGIRIRPLQVALTIGGQEDPAQAAQLYGYLHAAVWSVMPALEQLLTIPDPYIHVGMDFDSPDTKVEGEAGISIRIGTLIAAGFTVLIPALRWYMKWNKKKKQAQKQPVKKAAALDDQGKDEHNG